MWQQNKYLDLFNRLRGLFPIKRFLKLMFNNLDPSALPFLLFAPPGHYYSPIPTLKDTEGYDILLDHGMSDLTGINLRDAAQVQLVNNFAFYYPEMPFNEKPDITRYFFDNTWFKAGDAIILYSMLRQYKPKRIVEIGSGFSSAVMLDINELFLDHAVEFTFIEPNPSRLRGLLRESDLKKTKIIDSNVQQLNLNLFGTLDENDILFIDSSHVAKLGSDVNHIFFNILPQLNYGVIIHFHDIRWPFQYPRSTTEQGIAWNEAYFLRNFLLFNDTFNILFFNDYMAKVHSELMKDKLPKFMEWPGGSIWIQRNK